MKFYKIVRATIPRYPVVRLIFDDGFAGEVDFAEMIAGGGVMTLLGDPAAFAQVKIGEGGRSLGWIDAVGNDVDFCADALRFQAEEQVVRERAARYSEAKTDAAE
jgi:hypothetical protein